MSEYVERFQGLLRELFEFDCADLDFGIYRIMNHKRDAVERFIRKDLVEAISKEPSSGILASQSQAAAELKDLAAQIRESMGEAALNGDGNWSKQQFAEAHIFFFEGTSNYDYMAKLFG